MKTSISCLALASILLTFSNSARAEMSPEDKAFTNALAGAEIGAGAGAATAYFTRKTGSTGRQVGYAIGGAVIGVGLVGGVSAARAEDAPKNQDLEEIETDNGNE